MRHVGQPLQRHNRLGAGAGLLLVFLLTLCLADTPSAAARKDEAVYRHYLLRNATNGPVSVHVVRLNRQHPWRLETALARNREDGLATLRELVQHVPPPAPLAAVNGDFYARSGFLPGDPRGLMMAQGELLSAPSGGAVFWVDREGRWHLDHVKSLFNIAWSGTQAEPLGLNEALRGTRPVLYTAAYGRATPPAAGRFARELVLEPVEGRFPLPLRPGVSFRARVHTVSETGQTPLSPHTLVLAVSTNWLARNFLPLPGMTVRISLGMEPDLETAMTALGGGPIMIQGGKQRVHGEKAPHPKLPNTIKHIWDRHPRSALGWNRDALFLVAVDGRMPGWSDGWKIPELAAFMRTELGCTEAINLDGGGSTSLWFDGELRNSPADGEERPVANALLIYR
jgi:hypothetical protein